MNLLVKMLYTRKRFALAAICLSGLTAAVTLWWNAGLAGIISLVSAGTAPPPNMIHRSLGVMLIMGAASWAKGYVSALACEAMAHDLRMGYARHLSALPVSEAEKLNAGEQLSTLQNEIANVSGYLNANLFQLVDDGVRFLATFVWLMYISAALTLSANLPVFLILAYVVWSSKIIGGATALSQEAKGQMNRHADTLLTLFPVIRLYEAANLFIGGYTVAVRAWEAQTVRAERLRARLMSLSALLSSVPLLLLFLVGGHMALGIGTLYIFVNLSGNVSGVMMNMPGYIGAFRQFSANMARLEGKVCL